MLHDWRNRIKILKTELEHKGFETLFPEGIHAPGVFEVNHKRLYILYISEMDSGAIFYVSTKLRGPLQYAALSISDSGHIHYGPEFAELLNAN